MITVRAAGTEDVEAIVRVQEDASAASFEALVGRHFDDVFPLADRLREWTTRVARNSHDDGVLVAVLDGGIVGTAAWHCDAESRGEVEDLHVVPRAWGTGAARALLLAAVADLRAAGATAPFLWVGEANARARRFYEREGWSFDGTREPSPLGPIQLRYRLTGDASAASNVGSRAVSTTSYWLSEPSAPLPRVELSGPPDVAVVGGGITGCSCALALADAGLRVRLYESREIAGGASGRNGGFALRGGAAPYPVLADSLGREPTAGLWRWTERAVDELADIAGDAFRRTGSLRLAADEEERDELVAEYDALRADGFEAEWLDDLPAPLAGDYPAALVHPRDGVLQPALAVRRLAARAADAGVEIHEHTTVGAKAETGTDTVVVATDGYPSGLLGSLEGLIVPTRGQVIATEPAPELHFEVPHYGRHGFDYWHQRPDGRVVAGGFRDVSLQDEFTAEERTTPVVQEALERFVNGFFGRELRVDFRWAGIFGMVFDFVPVVGRAPDLDGVWMAGGYSGHGNVLGFACGKLVARAILGDRDPLLDLFEPSRLL